ncbi:MAG: hypothetical protein ABL995_04900 [Bryobacteraceae bacterium]
MDFLSTLENLPFSIWVRESGSIWAFPTILFMHTLGMSIVAGGSAMIDLILLGIWPKVEIKPLERMYPIMWSAFALNAITGTVLLVADATTKMTNWDFYVKMVFITIGTVVLAKMRTVVFADPNLDKAPITPKAKQLAWISLICWFGGITAGRLLAYLGPVSGLVGIDNK